MNYENVIDALEGKGFLPLMWSYINLVQHIHWFGGSLS